MAKALVLLSGGLDSMLAVKVLMEEGIEVTGISFRSAFFNTEKARQAAAALGIELIEVDFSEEHLAMVKNPSCGYGSNMNPCIDCHAMMFRWAASMPLPIFPASSPAPSPNQEIGRKEDLAAPFLARRGDGGEVFIATGEVLGQRPMSQNKEALKRVEKIACLENRILRPLSAKLLPETEMEKAGLVDREKLLDIYGRSRERQFELVARYNIKEYPSPGGGCLLTDPEFSGRLKKLFVFWPECGIRDVELIRNGRMFWAGAEALIMVGRNREECEGLQKLGKNDDIIVELKDETGPVTVVRFKNQESITTHELELEIPAKLETEKLKLEEGKSAEEILSLAGILTGYYAPKARGKKIKIEIRKAI